MDTDSILDPIAYILGLVLLIFPPLVCLHLAYLVCFYWRRSASSKEKDLQTDDIQRAATFFTSELNIRSEFLEEKGGRIGLVPLSPDVSGSCIYYEKKITILLNEKNLHGIWRRLFPFERTLAHEFVHAEQIITNKISYTKDHTIWLGKTYSKNYPYWIRPWEFDARKREKILYKKYQKSLKGNKNGTSTIMG